MKRSANREIGESKFNICDLLICFYLMINFIISVALFCSD